MKFRVLFTSNVLMQREMFALKKLKTLGIKVSFDSKEDIGSDAEIGGDATELVILDEADEFILDSPNVITAPNIVGLTATALDDLEEDSAADYLLQPKYMAFKVFDSAIPSDISANSYQEATLEKFAEESTGMAKLIFTSTSGYASMRAIFGK